VSYLDQWLNPEYPELYDAVIYNEESYDAFIWSLQRRDLRARVAALVQARGPLRYLDFACGTGRVLTSLEDLTDDVIGIDLAPPMVELARTKTRSTVLVGDVIDPAQRPEGQFDLITAFRFFLNVDEATRTGVMDALAAMLRPDGGVLIFNMHGNARSTASLVRWRPDAARSGNLMRISEVHDLVTRSGLKVVGMRGYGLSPRGLYYGKLARVVRAIDRRWGGRRLHSVSHDLVFICTR
jgi:SAM-dependent methyltransferase